ncbi:MAG TPA: NAD(P)-dependent oxidoreductase [Ohtaekwangia sp.]|uniref:NAD(P)-dependent oxidoreductase n=1 Tax=Ohtaekwangia sp. TaxID=2066019 RepID=UPI002F95F8A4
MADTIAFLGLGNMGYPMAKNLIESGFAVKVYNRSADKVKDLVTLGGQYVATVAEAVQQADIIITMVSEDEAVKELSAQILPVIKPGSIHLSMSTIHAETSRQLAEQFTAKKAFYVASPVLGRPPAAAARQLFILMSGDASAKERVKPALEAMGQRTFDFGSDPAIAHTVKLMMNFMIFGVVEMLSEVMLLAEKTGIDKNVMLDTMLSTVYGAPIFKAYGTLIVKEEEVPNGFASELASKDLRLVQETAAQVGLQLPLANLVRSHFEEIITAGAGKRDLSYLITYLRSKAE